MLQAGRLRIRRYMQLSPRSAAASYRAIGAMVVTSATNDIIRELFFRGGYHQAR